MQDEHFLREWNAGHAQFTAGFDHALNRAARQLRDRFGAVQSLGLRHDRNTEPPLARKARLTGTAVIGGLTAGLGLALSLFILAAVTNPVASPTARIVCVTPPPLA